MKQRTKIIANAVAVCFAVSSISVHADWVGDFYNSAGAGVNATMPQSIASSSVTGYSGGGVSWRIPSKNLQPFQVTPPSLRAGCGGIDAYLGSYSFVNKDAFVQSLRNFGQAAVGYFFQLALKTMAPEIESTLSQINDIASRMNQFSMNSCASAKLAVDTVSGALKNGWVREASGSERASGAAVDENAAEEDVKTDFQKVQDIKYKDNFLGRVQSALTAADAGKVPTVNINVLRWALENANAIDMSIEEKDLVMSLVGPSLIIRPAPAGDATAAPSDSGRGPVLTFQTLVGEDLWGAPGIGNPVKVLVCDTQAECLNPDESTVAFKTFAKRIEEAIIAIRSNVASRSSAGGLAADHKLVLKLASVPIYRAAAMAESGGVAAMVADQLLPKLADYAAIDAAVRFVSYYLAEADKALATTSAKMSKEHQPAIQAMRERIVSIRNDMHLQTRHYYAQSGDPYKQLETLEKAEKMMYSNLNTMLAANARFGKRQ